MGGACKPQCSLASVGDMDSNDDMATQPNSEAYVPGSAGPRPAGLSNGVGMRLAKSSRLASPFTDLKPEPCSYGPCVSIGGGGGAGGDGMGP